MKYVKKIIAILCCLSMIVVMSTRNNNAFAADPISMYQLGSIAYAIAQESGAVWSFTTGTAIGAQNYIENRINEYVGSSTLAEKFALDQARIVAGKLVVGQKLYNDIKTFLHTLFNGKTDGSVLSDGQIDGLEIGQKVSEGSTIGGLNFELFQELNSGGSLFSGLRVLLNGESISSGYYTVTPISQGGNYDVKLTGWAIKKSNSTKFYGTYYYDLYTRSGYIGSYSGNTYPEFSFPEATLNNEIKIYPSNYNETALNPGFQWEGTFDNIPDTNLDQLAGGIYDDIGLNDLDLTGEVVEEQPEPTPVPTPIPVNPDTPLQDVPWEGLNDLIGQTEQGINQQIQSQTQSVTSAQEATTEAVESLTETISGALDVPETDELPDFKFDLRELFPFCIPFDIYRLLSSFDAEPQAPHVRIPVVIESIGFNYTLDLDFSSWNPVAQAMRTAELIVYAIGLAWATGKVIKW